MTALVDSEAEKAVLGALLQGDGHPADVAEVFARLSPESFGTRAYAAVFDACRRLHSAQQPTDEIAVSGELSRQGEAVSLGVLAALSSSVPTSANLPHHAELVRERWLRRRLSDAAERAREQASNLQAPVIETANGAAKAIGEILATQTRGKMRSMAELVRERFRTLQDEHAKGVDFSGVRTGFEGLDRLTGGWQAGNLIIVGGRPSMGKSALAMAFAESAAVRDDTTTLVFSLEMSERELTDRAISSRARVSSQLLRQPATLRDEHWPKLAQAMSVLSTQRLQIVEAPGLTVPEMRAMARMCRARHGLGLVVVDYLQLIRPATRDPSRVREVDEISQGLKHLAKELSVPVICLAQLNRQLEQREQKRPRLSDLRESGGVEQDADLVLFVHREGYYSDKAPQDVAEVLIAKQRNGAQGVIELHWDERHARFEEMR